MMLQPVKCPPIPARGPHCPTVGKGQITGFHVCSGARDTEAAFALKMTLITTVGDVNCSQAPGPHSLSITFFCPSCRTSSLARPSR